MSSTWSYAQSAVDQTSYGEIYTAYSLIPTPGTITFDGIPSQNEFSVQSCPVGGGPCNDNPNTGYIQTSYTCPIGSSVWGTDLSGTAEVIACALSIPSAQPAPCNKNKSCLGNPIFAATGQKMQVVNRPGNSGDPECESCRHGLRLVTTIILLLKFGRWYVADRLEKPALLNQSTHSSVANSTASMFRQGTPPTDHLGFVEPNDRFREARQIGRATCRGTPEARAIPHGSCPSCRIPGSGRR
jgi:hypothetical protein